MSKKTLIIIIFTLFIIIFGWLLFTYFFANKITAPTTENTTEFPFGKVNTDNNTNSTLDSEQNNLIKNSADEINKKSEAKLKQIYPKPIAGSTFNSDKNTILRFIDREKGNLYEYNILKQEDPERITNTTIAKVQDVSWPENGNNLILRFLDNDNNVNNYSGEIKISTSTDGTIGEIKTGSILTMNSIQSVINPSGDKIFELINKVNKNGSYGLISSTKGENKKQIFDSPLSLFNINWVNDNIITFTTKPSYEDKGILYFFNIKNNSFDKIFGDIIGLITNTNKTADLVAYSGNDDKNFSLNIYNTTKNESTKLNISTLADKCVWSKNNTKILYCAVPKNIPNGNYPDDWYQGTVSFNDDFWMINTEEGTTKLLYENKDDSNMDAFDLKLSGDDKYLSFTNKNDLSLWLLDLTEITTAQ